jgi:hypothetical protein
MVKIRAIKLLKIKRINEDVTDNQVNYIKEYVVKSETLTL